ncbi:hypothetical protein KAR91_81425, partial [Candidatus Pacearchaeota archaeon]|nr:hypothetical protein [Candidatus Pacearchaeota archaeon]
MNKRRVSIPRMGDKYTEAFKDLMENLGLNVILPPKTTDKTVQIGVRNTAEMICFPIKPLIGNFAEALDAGADTLFMYDSMGQCRLKHYSKIQELALRDMGYTNFKMYSVGLQNVFQILNKLGGYSYLAILKEFISFYGIIKKIDKEKTKWSKDKPNIGIIGEIFTCCDER